MKRLIFILLIGAGWAQAQTTVLNGTSGNAMNSSNFSTGTSGSTITLSQGFFAEYLIVGGGGGGGGGGFNGGNPAGGGGGGGAGAVTRGSNAITAGNYNVVVGAGGWGGGGGRDGGGWNGAMGGDGSSSSAFGVTSVGGSAGWGAGINTLSPFAWTDGTGGWGGWSGSTSGGGKSYNTSGGAGGGGAGSTGVGGSTSGNTTGAVGGTGTAASLTGSSQTYGVGGAGGNGSSANVDGASGAANTGNGGGGGGGANGGTAKSGGAGGSGLVVVRYAGAQAGTGGTVTAGSGSAAGNTLHTFSSTGSSTLDFSGLNLDTRLKTTLTGAIAGSGNLSYTGPGTLVTKAVNTYSGTTTVNGGTLIVDTGASIANSSATTVGSGAHLKVNGAAGRVTVNGTLSGGGSVGALTLNSGGTLAVSSSPAPLMAMSAPSSISPMSSGAIPSVGTLTAASATWNSGSTFAFEIMNGTGFLGVDWDLLDVNGALDLTTINVSNRMNLTVLSGGLINYDPEVQYSWVFARAASLAGTGASWASGLDVTDRFMIDSTGFNGNNQPGRGFKVVTGTDGGFATLSLQAVPEPSSGALVGLALGAWSLLRARRSGLRRDIS